MITKFFVNTGSSLKEVFLSAPKFLQFLFAIRLIWWGFGAFFLNYHFTLDYLEYIEQPMLSFPCLLAGIIGLIGVLRNNYRLEIVFSIFNLTLFSLMALTCLKYDPRSMSSINFFVEMIGSMWLVFRIQHQNAASKKVKSYL